MSLPIVGDSSFFMNLYSRYQRDPASVPADWRLHFETQDVDQDRPAVASHLIAEHLVAAYRDHGHKQATLDPLSLASRNIVPEIAQANSLVSTADVEVSIAGIQQKLAGNKAVGILNSIYAGNIAIEATHVLKAEYRNWLYETFERETLAKPDDTTLATSLEAVLLADEFERFIKTKWPTKKRFGSEGSEGSAVILRETFRNAARIGFDEVVIGGMHRGRLATLATVLGKSLQALIAEIKGLDATHGDAHFTGDVPYHNGLDVMVESGNGPMSVKLLPHPSHLIVVAPVAMGAARARQEVRAQLGEYNKVLPLLMHTDAAFAGQGLVSEILQMGGIKGYSVGGTIHLVVNNQIGFTTLPHEGRSTPSPTDIGKAYGIPILHVNGDDPVAAAAAARVALAWRQHSGIDVIIDLVCYRRNGHNELDEPRFTQPLIWAAVDSIPTLRQSYSSYVRETSHAAFATAEKRVSEFSKDLEYAFETYHQARSNSARDETIVFQESERSQSANQNEATGVDVDKLIELGRILTNIPDGFSADSKVRNFAQARLNSIEKNSGINMATAEALAFATLLSEGVSVRLSGQDSVRGTFTQRHLAFHDKSSGNTFLPLSTLATQSNSFDAVNSPLIEYGVLGFEYGMSLADANRLIVWEAQFGDFLNGAQIAVDQYIVTAEAKWRMPASVVIALPHGQEGQGPDHSSARIERILQSCVGGNIIVANPSTPANLFHLLRRQQKGSQRKPLFLIAPKSLLREKKCQSQISDFGPNSSFNPILLSQSSKPAKKIVLCSGKIFFGLDVALAQQRRADVALLRLEQLYPFPLESLRSILHENADAELVWCQEEPRNQGAYTFVRDQLLELTPPISLRYVGRPAMAAAAGGSIDRHDGEQAEIINSALGERDGKATSIAAE